MEILEKTKYNITLGNYFENKPLFLNTQGKENPNIRKLVEQPWQQTKAAIQDTNEDRWNIVLNTLCDLYFIEAKCYAGLTFALIKDYYQVCNHIPENQLKLDEDEQHKYKIDNWIKDITEYSRKCSELDYLNIQSVKKSEAEPHLPEPFSSCPMWTQEEIDTECKRITENPTRFDKINAFKEFVASQSYPLIKYSNMPGFLFQHAKCFQPAGLVHDEALRILEDSETTFFSRCWPDDSITNPIPALLRTLESQGMQLINLLPDGRHVVFLAGSINPYLQIWDLENLQCLRTFKINFRSARCLNVTPDGKYAVIAGQLKETGELKNGLRAFDLTNGHCLNTIEINTFSFEKVFVTPDAHFTISLESTERLEVGKLKNGQPSVEIKKGLRLYDLYSGKCLKTIEIPNWEKPLLSISQNGRLVLLAGTGVSYGPVNYSNDKTLQLWDIASGTCLKIIELDLGTHGSISGINISQDGQSAMTMDSQRLRTWDLATGLCLRTIINKGMHVLGSCTSDWQRGISTNGNSLIIWDLIDGRQIRTFEDDSYRIDGVSLSIDGRFAISWSSSGILRRWNLERGQCIPVLNKHTNLVTSISISSDGQNAVTSGKNDNKLHVWKLQSGKCEQILKVDKCSLSSFSIIPDRNQVVTGGGYFGGISSDYPNLIHKWNLESGLCLQSFEDSKKNVTKVRVTSDGSTVVSVHDDKKIRVWDVANGQCKWTLEGHEDQIECLSISKNSRLAFSGGGSITYGAQAVYKDCTIRVWDIEKGKCLKILQGHTNFVSCVLEIPNKQRIISGSWDHTVRVWDLKSGNCIHIMEIPSLSTVKSSVRCISLTPDGHYAVSGGSMYGKLILWDLEKGECKRNYLGHMGDIRCVFITANGQYIVSGCTDRTIRIWEIETGKCIALFSTFAPVESIALSPASSSLVCGMTTGEVIILEIHGIDFFLVKPGSSKPEDQNPTINNKRKFWKR